MSIKTKFSIAIMDTEKISEINKIIMRYSDKLTQTSSHILFNTQPINLIDIVQDLTYFHLSAETEDEIDEKLNELIEKLNELNTDYSLRNEDTGKMLEHVKCVGALDIKFDNIDVILEGTYKKIDSLKYTKTEFGYCKGYKPQFRPLESQSIKGKAIKNETIYLFSKTPENMLKLREYLSEKIMEINSDLIIEHRQFT